MSGFVQIVDASGQVIANLDKYGNQTFMPYPAGATPIVGGSGNVANSTATATLAGVAGKTTYITGFEITGSGATVALAMSPTVAGLLGGTLTYTHAAIAGVLSVSQPLMVQYNPPLPASAVNTSIVVTVPAYGLGNTNSTVVAHGYQL